MINAEVKDGEHHTILKGGKETEKRRKLDENRDIALVSLKRTIEEKKAQKIQKNLHLIDFPKQNDHIFFVSDPAEVKNLKPKDDIDEDDSIESDNDDEPNAEKYQHEKDKYIDQLRRNQSENKGQYKKLADAMIKGQ